MYEVCVHGRKEVPSAISILRGVQVVSNRRRRLCATNSKSEDISLQSNCLHSLAIRSGVLKIVTYLVWEHIRNAIICVVASSSYLLRFSIYYALLGAHILNCACITEQWACLLNFS